MEEKMVELCLRPQIPEILEREHAGSGDIPDVAAEGKAPGIWAGGGEIQTQPQETLCAVGTRAKFSQNCLLRGSCPRRLLRGTERGRMWESKLEDPSEALQ
jgi:hypothetical protein